MTLPCDLRTDEDRLADLNADLDPFTQDDEHEGAVGAFFVGAVNAVIVGMFFWSAVLLVVFG